MNSFTIFFVIAVAAVSADTSAIKCKTDRECQPHPLLGIRYYCEPDLKVCYSKQLTSPQPTDRPCTKPRDCLEPLYGVKFYCDPSTKTCYSRQVLPPQPTDRHCETREDCYRVPVGVEYYCDTVTETCATRPIV